MRGDYGLHGYAKAEGKTSLDAYATNYSFQGNVIISRKCDLGYTYTIAHFAAIYPLHNSNAIDIADVGFTDYDKGDYRLKDSSKFRKRGTDGKDSGPNINSIIETTKGTLSGQRDMRK